MVRVAIVEDDREIREGLGRLIDLADGFCCAGQYGSVEEASIAFAADVQSSALPRVVLMDIGLPGQSGIVGIRLMKELYPNVLFLVLTVYTDDARIFDALCAGASGYLLKKTPSDRLVEGIAEVIEGGAPMSPEIALRVIQQFRTRRNTSKAETGLTPHQIRLLKLLVDGHNYRTAAQELDVSVNTISFHMRQIYEKLHVHSKSQAVAAALKNRLFD